MSYVLTVVRTGKEPLAITVESGTTLRAAFDQQGIPTAEYTGWHITDDEGDTLTLNSQVFSNMFITCGVRTRGAA